MTLDVYETLRHEIMGNLIVDGEPYARVYVNYAPEEPDFITIQPVFSEPLEGTCGFDGTGLLGRFHGSIRVRAQTYEDAYARLRETMLIMDELRGAYRYIITGTIPPMKPFGYNYGNAVDYGCYFVGIGGI